jgi:hypothetical protein
MTCGTRRLAVYLRAVYICVYWRKCQRYRDVISPLLHALAVWNNLYLCHVTQGGQGKYSSVCRVSLSLTVLPTNLAIINAPLV